MCNGSWLDSFESANTYPQNAKYDIIFDSGRKHPFVIHSYTSSLIILHLKLQQHRIDEYSNQSKVSSAKTYQSSSKNHHSKYVQVFNSFFIILFQLILMLYIFREYHLLITIMRLNQHNAATSVYLQQITNHIEVGQGYSQLRKHLFRELHQQNNGEVVSDDKLSDSIVSYLSITLNRTVNFHRSMQTFRIMQIIEDLLTYAEEVMTPAMHNESFISALVHVANPKIITFDLKTDTECRNHALGIFLFWFDRYGREEDNNYELFIQAYKQLKDKKILFPNSISIKPNDSFKKELEKQKNAPNPPESNEGKTNRIILDDIEAFTIKTQSLFKENFKSIATTEYVRLIKHKSKQLFQFTSKPNDFKEKEKTLVKDLYKRLRFILKEIDKYKETSLQTKKSQETEKQYVEAKMTPKKAQNQQSLLNEKVQATPEKKVVPIKKQSSVHKASEDVNLLDIGPALKKPSSQKQPVSVKISPSPVVTFDLLNENPQINPKVEEQEEFVEGILITNTEQPKQPQSQQEAVLFQVFSTPKKEVHDEEGAMLAKQNSNHSQELSPAFDNQKMAKNPYSYIPEHLNLTPTSSVQDDEEKVQEKPIFSFFGLLNPKKPHDTSPETFEEQAQHYDSVHKKGKKYSEQTPKKIIEEPKQQHYKVPQIKDIVNSPNYKPVAAVNYQIYAKYAVTSPHKEDQETKFQLTPKKSGDKDLNEVQFGSPKSGEKIKDEE